MPLWFPLFLCITYNTHTRRGCGGCCWQAVAVNATPCGGGGALARVSCSAAALRVDVVVDVVEAVACGRVDSFGGGDAPPCPSDGLFLYNTQVALNASGTVRAVLRRRRWRRSSGDITLPCAAHFGRLLGSTARFICMATRRSCLTRRLRGSTARSRRALASRSVRASVPARYVHGAAAELDAPVCLCAGMMVCFDIMFGDAEVAFRGLGVTDAVMSSWWVNVPPLLTGTQARSLAARAAPRAPRDALPRRQVPAAGSICVVPGDGHRAHRCERGYGVVQQRQRRVLQVRAAALAGSVAGQYWCVSRVWQ